MKLHEFSDSNCNHVTPRAGVANLFSSLILEMRFPTEFFFIIQSKQEISGFLRRYNRN
jgi:hypothetical protein